MHERLAPEARGVLYRGAVSAAVARARFGPFEGDGDLFERAALLARGIALDPFLDGNKRTALAVLDGFLSNNGSKLDSDADVVALVLDVARGDLDVMGIRGWLLRNVRRV